MRKTMDFISRLQRPEDRIEMCKRFGIDVVNIIAPASRRGPVFGIGGISAVARHDPPPRADTPSDGIIRDEASLMAAVSKVRGMAPAPAPLPDGPADCVIRSEADLMAEVARHRAALGV